MTFTDSRGHEYPLGEPGGIYLGSLHRGRVCFDHRGTKIKVLAISQGSALVRYEADKATTLSLEMVVYLAPTRAPVPAPKAMAEDQETGPGGSWPGPGP